MLSYLVKPQELGICQSVADTVGIWKAAVHVGQVAEVLVCLACDEVSVFKVHAFLIDVLYSFKNPHIFCMW